MKKISERYALLFCTLVMLSSCYKVDYDGDKISTEPNYIAIKGIYADAIIPERNSIWGRIVADKVEYNFQFNSQIPLNYTVPTASYHTKSSKVLAAIRNNTTYNIEVTNLFNSIIDSIISTTVSDCAIANNKLYILGWYSLKVLDLSTFQPLDSATIIGGAQMAVSMDGSMIYISNGSHSSRLYVFELNSTNNLNDLVNYEAKASFTLDPGTFSMSRDGKKIILEDGRLFDNYLTQIYDFNDDRPKYFLSGSGNSVITTNHFIKVYKIDNSMYYPDIEVNPNDFGENFQNSIPYSIGNTDYVAISNYPVGVGQQTILYKLTQ